MITLTDVRNDLRIRKEAETLARDYDVYVVSLIDDLPPGGFEFRRLNVINIRLRTRRLPKSPVFWLIKYAEFVIRAGWAASRVRAAVYHGHEIAGSVPALLAARRRRAKFIYDAHELEADRAGHIEKTPWLRRLLLWSLRFVMRRADHVICASESRADIMLAEYGARKRPIPILNVTPCAGMPMAVFPKTESGAHHKAGDVHHIPDGTAASPEPQASACATSIASPSTNHLDIQDNGCPFDLTGRRVVLYQGTLAPGRGLDRVVAALRYLDKDIVLMVLGHGSTFDALIEQAEREGTRDRLVMVGQVPADALTAYMNRAHVGLAIYLNTCRNNYHCAPNKIYEYASVGLPVVAPNFPDVEAVVTTFDIGRTFDPEHPESIAEAIRDVLNNPTRRDEMSRHALELKNRVNWDGKEEKVRHIYDQLLNR